MWWSQHAVQKFSVAKFKFKAVNVMESSEKYQNKILNSFLPVLVGCYSLQPPSGEQGGTGVDRAPVSTADVAYNFYELGEERGRIMMV
jgi:hypothetical protein